MAKNEKWKKSKNKKIKTKKKQRKKKKGLKGSIPLPRDSPEGGDTRRTEFSERPKDHPSSNLVASPKKPAKTAVSKKAASPWKPETHTSWKSLFLPNNPDVSPELHGRGLAAVDVVRCSELQRKACTSEVMSFSPKKKAANHVRCYRLPFWYSTHGTDTVIDGKTEEQVCEASEWHCSTKGRPDKCDEYDKEAGCLSLFGFARHFVFPLVGCQRCHLCTTPCTVWLVRSVRLIFAPASACFDIGDMGAPLTLMHYQTVGHPHFDKQSCAAAFLRAPRFPHLPFCSRASVLYDCAMSCMTRGTPHCAPKCKTHARCSSSSSSSSSTPLRILRNVHGVFPVHERFWFCLVRVSTTQCCSFPPVLMCWWWVRCAYLSYAWYLFELWFS